MSQKIPTFQVVKKSIKPGLKQMTLTHLRQNIELACGQFYEDFVNMGTFNREEFKLCNGWGSKNITSALHK